MNPKKKFERLGYTENSKFVLSLVVKGTRNFGHTLGLLYDNGKRGKKRYRFLLELNYKQAKNLKNHLVKHDRRSHEKINCQVSRNV